MVIDRVQATVSNLTQIGGVQKHSDLVANVQGTAGDDARPVTTADAHFTQPVGEPDQIAFKRYALTIHTLTSEEVRELAGHTLTSVAEVRELAFHTPISAEVRELTIHTPTSVAEVRAFSMHTLTSVAEVRESTGHTLTSAAFFDAGPIRVHIPRPGPGTPSAADPRTQTPHPPTGNFRVTPFRICQKFSCHLCAMIHKPNVAGEKVVFVDRPVRMMRNSNRVSGKCPPKVCYEPVQIVHRFNKVAGARRSRSAEKHR